MGSEISKGDSKSLLAKVLAAPTAPGIFLFLAMIIGLVVANSSARELYSNLLHAQITLGFSSFVLSYSLEHWINDGLMAIFFLMVGLEIKREFLSGELSSPAQALLPLSAALGGMLFPAGIYAAFNIDSPEALKAWAVPCATDIAFSLGILALLGKRVPNSLKIFLTALAIFDDLGAIIVIAIFYTAGLNTGALWAVLGLVALGLIINRLGVKRIFPYLGLGLLLWLAVLKSGIHATLAGVVLALLIPYRVQSAESPLLYLEHKLHHLVAFIILPIFAFANSGLDISMLTIDNILRPVSLGIILGLFFGKQLGIFIFTYVPIRLGLARAPVRASTLGIYAVAALGGVGFTMSLFIAGLAFPGGGLLEEARAGILIGSLLSGLFAYIILRFGQIRQSSVVQEKESKNFI